MSSFTCQTCGAPHIDTDRGYISGCDCYGSVCCDRCGKKMPEYERPGWRRCASCVHEPMELAARQTGDCRADRRQVNFSIRH